MAKSGYIREIDQLGRLVIPKQYRKELDIPDEGGTVLVTSKNGVISITKENPTCVFCRSKKNLGEFKGKPVCPRCLAEIKGEAAE